MKRVIILMGICPLLVLLAFCEGCSSNNNGGTGGDAQNQEVTQADYDLGVSQGYSNGYQRGYADGKKGNKNPEANPGPGVSAAYAAGYQEGFTNGYGDGYQKGLAETGNNGVSDGSEEKAAVESAMLAFVQKNSAPGLQFKIENIVIHGDEAAGIAVCTSEKLDSPLVLMKKGSGGWYGVDFGTGIEPPSWYQY